VRAQAFFVTGTDTGVGKTTVSCAVASALAARGLRVGVSKPAETGCAADADGSLVPADAVRLKFFAGCAEPLDVVCPERYAEPLAPSIAARRAGREVDWTMLQSSVRGVAERHDVTLVEGAGGLLVPLAGTRSFADMAAELRLPVVVVVGNRLGALNHALLTLRQARALGLSVIGYVVNTLSAESDAATQTNVDTLADLVGPALGVLPWLGPVECTLSERSRLAAAAEASLALSRLLG
jgi:dethiobiotin synthetase